MEKHLKVCGLRKCSTCQKALAALAEAGWQVDFQDVREMSLTVDKLSQMLHDFGDKLVNRASLTWRAMDDDARQQDPVSQILERPSLMKRPAIEGDGIRLLGWTANVKRRLDVPL